MLFHTRKITVIPGDGIGPEVIAAALKVIEATVNTLLLLDVENKQQIRKNAGELQADAYDPGFVMTLKVGSKRIEFEKGKTGISIPSKEKLVGVIETLIAAVRAGELDSILEQQGKVGAAPKAKRAA